MQGLVRFTYLWLLFCFTQSCYEPVEACLDPLASNYDVTTDNICDACCTYPPIAYELKHMLADSTITFGVVLTNNINDTFILLDQAFYLHRVHLYDIDSNEIPLLDSISVILSNESVKFADDLVVVNKNNALISGLNAYRTDKDIHSMKILFGVDDLFNQIDIAKLAGTSSLIPQEELYDTIKNKYFSAFYKFVAGPELKDTLSIHLEQDASYTIVFEKPIAINRGQVLNVPFTIDYDILFKDVEFGSGDIIKIKNQLEANIKNFIHE